MTKNRGDKVLFAMVLILMIFGLVMITSVGVSKSIQISAPADLAYPSCNDSRVDCYLILRNHIYRLILGSICMFIAMKIPMKFWKKISVVLFGGSIFLLFLLLVFGSKYTTFAKSWFVILNTSIQPAEFAKLGLIFYLANWLEKKSSQVQSFEFGFLPFCIITGLIVLPVMLEPAIGSAIVILFIAVTMFFSAGARVRHLLLGGLVSAIVIIILVSSVSYVRDRFSAFFNTSTACSQSYCWQSEQADIAVGSGGFWGKGLTQGVQKNYWLPEVVDDTIFAASAEELGFVRIVLLVIIYAVIAYRGYKISLGAQNKFTQYTAVGLTTWIVFQALMNITVNVGLMPVTGVTLPFVSYGGTSLITVMVAAGILIHISQQNPEYASDSKRRGERRSYHPQYRSYR